LRRTEIRFRKSQTGDGGWGYSFPDNSSTATMTAAGLMALALGNALKENGDNANNLRTSGAPVPITPEKNRNENKEKINDQQLLRGLARLEAFLLLDQQGQNPFGDDNYYLIWSIERVGMALGIERIGRLEWYRWGAERLIKKQQPNGSWAGGGYSGSNETLSTSFALLFLNRANLTKELTKNLRSRADLNIGGGDGSTAQNKTPATRNSIPQPVTKGTPKSGANSEAKESVPAPARNLEEEQFDREADRLCQKLLRAPASERASILDELRDSKGAVYTEALIRAASQSPQTLLADIRENLALRLKRMTKATLADMMKDPNKEIRLGAARAAGLKQEPELIVNLIDLLVDTENAIAQAARQSLKSLSSGKDFGPKENASADEKLRAITAWRTWANKQ
jgi:hypothetical protein